MTAAREEDRFARARLIAGWDQDRLTASTAIVIGVGALGNEVAKNLALSGIGRVILCDPDIVATSNLSRTALFEPRHVGMPKATAAAASLARLAPDSEVLPRTANLVSGVGLGELAAADVVLGCLDSVRARLELLGRCALVDAALVDGGTGSWEGEVRLRRDPVHGCFGCTLGARERATSDAALSCGPAAADDLVPASIVATAIVGGWMTVAALRIMLGFEPGFELLRVDAVIGCTESVVMRRDPACPYHRPLPTDVRALAVTNRGTVGDLLASLPEGADPVSWARFPIASRCAVCEAREIPRGEPGPDQARRCPRCGTLLPARFSERLRDAPADRVLGQLGVAPREILTVRLRDGGREWCRLG